jgi:hypothetical protein
MGEALDVLFVRSLLGTDGKAAAQDIVARLLAAMRDNIGRLTWMDDATRKAGLEKLAHTVTKIGYPDAWHSYDALDVGASGSYLDDVAAAATFELHRQLAKVGKPVDRSEWDVPPSGVDAWYHDSLNDIAAGGHSAAFVVRSARNARGWNTAPSARLSATRLRTASTTRAASSTPVATTATGGPPLSHQPLRPAPIACVPSTAATRCSTTPSAPSC